MVQGSVKFQKSDFDIEKYDNLIKELSNTDQYIPKGMVYTKVRERIVVPETVCILLAEKGSQKQDTATTYNNIALVYQDQGDYVKALEYYKKALVISEKVQGPEHPDTATKYNNYGLLYYDMQDYAEAKRYLQRAYDVFIKVLGEDHPYTKIAKKALEAVIKELGE